MPPHTEVQSHEKRTVPRELELGATRYIRRADLPRRSFLKGALAGTASLLAVQSRGVAATQQLGNSGKPSSRDQAGELTDLSIGDASELVRRRRVSPIELTSACLKQIEKLNPTLNAFITVTPESAAAEARAAEAEIQRGKWRGPLHGIPVALKDLFVREAVFSRTVSRPRMLKLCADLKLRARCCWARPTCTSLLSAAAPSSRTSAACIILGSSRISPAGRRVAPLRRSQDAFVMARSDRIRLAPSGSRRRIAASSALNPPMVW